MNRVWAGTHEGLDPQILFEQLDLPVLTINGGDGGSSETAMIGEKHQDALLFLELL